MPWLLCTIRLSGFLRGDPRATAAFRVAVVGSEAPSPGSPGPMSYVGQGSFGLRSTDLQLPALETSMLSCKRIFVANMALL